MERPSAQPIEHPTDEQVRYYLLEAALFEDVAEHGGMTAEEAQQRRRQLLARIGMGTCVEFGEAQ